MTIEEFIQYNIELIDENRWNELYRNALYIENKANWAAGQLTDLLLSAGVDPLTIAPVPDRLPPLYLKNSILEEIVIPENIEIIRYGAFYKSVITKIILPKSIIKIEQNAFISLPKSCQIIYNGTVAEFDNIEIEYPGQFGGKQVICNDGIWEFQPKNI